MCLAIVVGYYEMLIKIPRLKQGVNIREGLDVVHGHSTKIMVCVDNREKWSSIITKFIRLIINALQIILEIKLKRFVVMKKRFRFAAAFEGGSG